MGVLPSYDSVSEELILTSESEGIGEIATILDGQHRIEGLRNFKENVFEVPVCVFVGADMHMKATIFATVNLAQTKVNRSLAYDLLSYEKLDSPQKVAHLIAVNLDRMKESPLNGRIKRLGVATEGRTRETLTQATVVEALIENLISGDVVRDRNMLWKLGNRQALSHSEDLRYPFRSLYRESRDSDILANLINYFIAIKNRYPDSWSGVSERGNILPRTNGFRAMMWGLREVYPKLKRQCRSEVLSSSQYSGFLGLVDIADGEFTTEHFPAGSSGEAKIKDYLKRAAAQL